MAIRAILYDHDGTLVDSEVVHFGIWQKVLEGIDRKAQLELVDYQTHLAGIPTPANAVFLKQHFALQISAPELTLMKEKATEDYLANHCFPLLPGVTQSFAVFSDLGCTLAVVTGAGRAAVTRSLQGHKLNKMFEQVISADDVKRSKPAPDCYLLALQKLGLSAQECVAIEDTEHGAKAARDAGIDCVVIPNSMSKNQNFANSSKVCASMLEATEWITAHYKIDFAVKPMPI